MKIICIARNYTAHIEELSTMRRGSGGVDSPPSEGWRPEADGVVFFMKPDTALLRNNDPFFVPDFSAEVDYECELVVRINRVGRSIAPKFAHRYYDEVGLGIDFTARDLQREAVAGGLPWEMCKSFDRSAALSPEFIKLADLGGDVQNLHFEMRLNGEMRQSGHTAEMIHTVDEIIAHVSRFVTLKMGDLIYTGTPVGVGRVDPSDHLVASLEGRTLLDFQIR
ncbi:MAG: fumarylacetoacetate hydrolase family protein [Alistipes sp.]|jgi:2-keto-4-pentenoate hydratase/2-oxohepta-3-ene-1,7-dioic acid hydratase in catechol pathway|nr:fumarylacetoacetate hydrolase family protein [Alistipes sp.]